MYEILQRLQKNNRTYKKFKPIGIVVHETADPGATDEDESRYFDSTARKISAHVFIDWDSIIQKIPFDETAWHSGKTANNRYLGIELCRPAGHDTDKFQQVWARAVWCFAYIFINYIHCTAIVQETLPSHAECSKWWHETNHTDPDGYFSEYEKTVDDFRHDVQQEIIRQVGDAQESRPIRTGLVVTANVLNCRMGPGLHYDIIKQFVKGDFVTAIDSVNGWWKLDVDGMPGYVYKIYTKKRAF